MNLSEKDYKRLYLLQDKVLSWWANEIFPFYLTGDTALGRFYLNHRYSEDLDFFTNNDSSYKEHIKELRNKLASRFPVNIQQSLFTDDFTRFFISEKDVTLKIEFVNDTGYYTGEPASYRYGKIDTPVNILANKLTALIGRDEPKDVFDIIHISGNYSFVWPGIFSHAKQKASINELDVAQRMASFPVDWLMNIHWLISPVDLNAMRTRLNTIADDFLLGKANSLGKDHPPIESALPFTA